MDLDIFSMISIDILLQPAEILDFPQKSHIWNRSKNISTEPIQIIFNFLKTSRADSFISEVLVTSDKNVVPYDAHT